MNNCGLTKKADYRKPKKSSRKGRDYLYVNNFYD